MLKDKAIENLAAGELLLERGYVNAAASRLYYAMYEAAVHRLTQRGFRPERVRSGAVDWDHSMVENNTRLLREHWRDRLLYLEMRRMRGQADSEDAPVSAADLRVRLSSIRDFVREVGR